MPFFTGADSDALSEEESGPEDSELQDDAGSGDEKVKTKGKRKKSLGKRARSRKALKTEPEPSCEEDTKGGHEELTEEEEKKKADSLWAGEYFYLPPSLSC